MTYQEILSQFETDCQKHLAIKSFGSGPLDWLDNPQNIEFPLIFLRPLTSPGLRMNNNGYGATHVINFELYSLDIPHIDDSENNKILSNTEQYLYDITSQWNFGTNQQNAYLTLTSVSPVWEAFNDRATGWAAQIQVTTTFNLNYCDYPQL